MHQALKLPGGIGGKRTIYDKEEGACREIRLRDFMIKLYNLVK